MYFYKNASEKEIYMNFYYLIDFKERTVSHFVAKHGPAVRYYSNINLSNKEKQPQKRQKLLKPQKPNCYNTTIRSILDGQNLFLVENKW